jgi:anti-anti-sigma factor
MPNFDVQQESQCATVIPAGDVVASAVSELRPLMRDLVRSGVREMVFDLVRVEMIDSTGIGLLLSAHNSMTQTGGKFSVVRASAEVMDLLRTMRLHQHFAVSGRETNG